ncbi:uncharacterized protein LOC132632287 [Lycium barbarum]|uniref:uncharacterized protein LOC132632287 n=1 Tax=Lycium barbarum TaxID=112863 RepID=UPI00293EEF83|nr:uncharacterized protein LOC132632287 [Lycium barbarum]
MDSLQMKKIQAINKYRKQRLLNNLMFYSFTALTSILLLSSPLWYPLLCAFLKSLFFDSLPKICALFFSSKCIFIVGNIIIIFLVGESKIFKSRSSSSLPSNVLKQNYTAEQENEEKGQKNFIFLAGETKISRSSYSCSLPFIVNLKHGEQEEELCGYVDEEEKDQKGVNLESVMDGIMGNYCTSKCRDNEELEKEEKFQEYKFGTEPNELSKRADDFIARVNKQIRLEAGSMI